MEGIFDFSAILFIPCKTNSGTAVFSLPSVFLLLPLLSSPTVTPSLSSCRPSPYIIFCLSLSALFFPRSSFASLFFAVHPFFLSPPLTKPQRHHKYQRQTLHQLEVFNIPELYLSNTRRMRSEMKKWALLNQRECRRKKNLHKIFNRINLDQGRGALDGWVATGSNIPNWGAEAAAHGRSVLVTHLIKTNVVLSHLDLLWRKNKQTKLLKRWNEWWNSAVLWPLAMAIL